MTPEPQDQKPAGKAGGRPAIPLMPEVEVVPLERLRQYPFLSGIAETILKKLQPNLIERTFRAGDLILRAGDYSDAAHYLAEGIVEVRLSPVEAPTRRPAARPAVSESAAGGLLARVQRIFKREGLEQAVQQGGVTADGTVILSDMPVDARVGERIVLERGEIFGELSALSRYPVSADVVAVTDVVCLLIRTSALRLMFKQKACAEFKAAIDQRYRTRTLSTHLRNVELFAEVDAGLIRRLQEAADLLSFEPGAQIIDQGATGDALYLVRGGYVKVSVTSGGDQLAVTYLRKGDYAGEIALLMDEPWPFSLFALEHVEIVKISRDDFAAIIKEYPDVERTLWQAVVARLKQRGSVARNPLSSQ